MEFLKALLYNHDDICNIPDMQARTNNNDNKKQKSPPKKDADWRLLARSGESKRRRNAFPAYFLCRAEAIGFTFPHVRSLSSNLRGTES